jgi:hypothetical protein
LAVSLIKRPLVFAMRMQGRQQGGGGDQLDLLDAAHLAQVVAQLLQALERPLDQQNLHGLVVFQEDVLGRDHLFHIAKLGLGQGMAHPAVLGAIDQGDGPGQDGVGARRAMLGKLVADQFGDHLRAAGQAALGDHDVQLNQQFGRQADAQAGQG